MKKQTLTYVIIILVVLSLATAGYWYWQSQGAVKEAEVKPLQTVALDKPDTDSFDDVCTKKSDYELDCVGNIQQFGCYRYSLNPNHDFSALEPNYPVLECDKKDTSDQGVYTELGTDTSSSQQTIVDYIIIADGSFQLIESVDQFIQVFQPIESVDEAKAYFSLLDKGLLILDQETLAGITSPQVFHKPITSEQARFKISVDSLGLSQITETSKGYVITAYSDIPAACVDEVYFYEYLLKYNGELVQESKQLVWEVLDKPSCIHE